MQHYHRSTSLLQFRSDCIVSYTPKEDTGSSAYTSNFTSTGSTSAKKTYSGTVTACSKKNQRKACDLMVQCTVNHKVYNEILGHEIDFQIGLITLTLSDNTRFINGQECHKTCLRPFLDWLTKTKGCNFYLWKAERQSKTDNSGRIKLSNGQLHYHILIDIYIDWNEVRAKWNYLQDKAGYLEEFYNKYHHRNPNSTDIHKMYEVNDLSAYLLKYITKEAEKEAGESDEDYQLRTSVGGKVWDCSTNLKGRKYYSTITTETIANNIDYLIKTNYVSVFKSDYTCILFFNTVPPTIILPMDKRHDYVLHLKSIIDCETLPKKKFVNSYDKIIKDLTRKRIAVKIETKISEVKVRIKRKRKFERKKEIYSLQQNMIDYGKE